MLLEMLLAAGEAARGFHAGGQSEGSGSHPAPSAPRENGGSGCSRPVSANEYTIAMVGFDP